MNELEKQVRDIAKENEVHTVMVGNRVYEASKYAPEIVEFTSQKYLFLNHHYAGLPLDEAARKAGMDVEEAGRFLDSPKAIDWLKKRAIRDYIRQDWEGGGKWIEMGEKVLNGEKHLSKDQQVVYMAFGERFAPKPKSESGEAKTVINFNFTAEDVKKALSRQESINAELSQ